MFGPRELILRRDAFFERAIATMWMAVSVEVGATRSRGASESALRCDGPGVLGGRSGLVGVNVLCSASTKVWLPMLSVALSAAELHGTGFYLSTSDWSFTQFSRDG